MNLPLLLHTAKQSCVTVRLQTVFLIVVIIIIIIIITIIYYYYYYAHNKNS
jgi:RsiW-degrading membrane proteinase PrsW (M82 family)